MSEQEIKTLCQNLKIALRQSTLRMLERKAKLGEPVIIADSNGLPLEISAEEALRIFDKSEQNQDN